MSITQSRSRSSSSKLKLQKVFDYFNEYHIYSNKKKLKWFTEQESDSILKEINKNDSVMIVIECIIGRNDKEELYVLGGYKIETKQEQFFEITNVSIIQKFNKLDDLYAIRIYISPNIVKELIETENMKINENNVKVELSNPTKIINDMLQGYNSADIQSYLFINNTNIYAIKYNEIIYKSDLTQILNKKIFDLLPRDRILIEEVRNALSRPNIKKIIFIFNNRHETYINDNFNPSIRQIRLYKKSIYIIRLLFNLTNKWLNEFRFEGVNNGKSHFYFVPPRVAIYIFKKYIQSIDKNQELIMTIISSLLKVIFSFIQLELYKGTKQINLEKSLSNGLFISKFWFDKILEAIPKELINIKIKKKLETQYLNQSNIDNTKLATQLYVNWSRSFLHIIHTNFKLSLKEMIDKISDEKELMNIYLVSNGIEINFDVNGLISNLSKLLEIDYIYKSMSYHIIEGIDVSYIDNTYEEELLELSRVSYFTYLLTNYRSSMHNKLKNNIKNIQKAFIKHEYTPEFKWLKTILWKHYIGYNSHNLPRNLAIHFTITTGIKSISNQLIDITKRINAILKDFLLTENNNNNSLTTDIKYGSSLYAFITSLNRIYSFRIFLDYTLKLSIIEIILGFVPSSFEVGGVIYTIPNITNIKNIFNFAKNSAGVKPISIVIIKSIFNMLINIYSLEINSSNTTKSDKRIINMTKIYMFIINILTNGVNNLLNNIFQNLVLFSDKILKPNVDPVTSWSFTNFLKLASQYS